jgi:hypothetical protein
MIGFCVSPPTGLKFVFLPAHPSVRIRSPLGWLTWQRASGAKCFGLCAFTSPAMHCSEEREKLRLP